MHPPQLSQHGQVTHGDRTGRDTFRLDKDLSRVRQENKGAHPSHPLTNITVPNRVPSSRPHSTDVDARHGVSTVLRRHVLRRVPP